MNRENEKTIVLEMLHRRDVWDERLLSAEIFGHIERLLEPREFYILEEKVAGKTDHEIWKSMLKNSPQGGMSFERFKRTKREIKQKIRTSANPRVQGWIENQGWKKEPEENNEELWKELP